VQYALHEKERTCKSISREGGENPLGFFRSGFLQYLSAQVDGVSYRITGPQAIVTLSYLLERPIVIVLKDRALDREKAIARWSAPL
jgi:hypothetical protein